MISFVIPTYNNRDVEKAINSLCHCPGFEKHECLVIVNNPDEKWSLFLKKKFQKINNVRVIYLDKPNISMARNKGIKESRGEYIVFYEDDCHLSSDYVAVLEKILKKGEGIIRGKTIFEENGDKLTDLYSWLRGVWYGNTKPTYTPNLIVRKDIFGIVGNYEPAASGFADDSEWGWRAVAKGYFPMYYKELIMFHKAEKPTIRKWFGYGIGTFFKMKSAYLSNRSVARMLGLFMNGPRSIFRARTPEQFLFVVAYETIKNTGLVWITLQELKRNILE